MTLPRLHGRAQLLRAAVLSLALAFIPAARAAAQSPADSSRPAGSHDHPEHGQEQAAETAKPAAPLPPFIPPLTDEDRRAAFPDVEGHTVHDQAVHYLAMFDRLEWQPAAGGTPLDVDAKGWVGRDRDRLWLRAEGGADDGRLEEAQAHVLFGRQFSRWWDAVAGIRQDFRPGRAQTWAAIGVQGLAPYWFEVEATAYVGASGRTEARFEVEYELLLTNRLVLQPLLEVHVAGKSDPERRVGAGLRTTEAGMRLRYEFRREIAPYVGVTWNRTYGETGDFAEAAGEDTEGARLVTGVRIWF
jgi:copper resistance protein B